MHWHGLWTLPWSARITRDGVYLDVRMRKVEPPGSWSFEMMNPFGVAVRWSSHMHGQTVKDRGTHRVVVSDRLQNVKQRLVRWVEVPGLRRFFRAA